MKLGIEFLKQLVIFICHVYCTSSEEVVESYEKRGNCENTIKEAKYDMAVGHLLPNHFGTMKRSFS